MNSNDVLMKQAWTAFQACEKELAASICKRALEKAPDNDIANNILGLITMDEGHYIKSAQYIAKAIAIKPDKYVYHINLARLLLLMKLYDKALLACNKSLSLEPDSYQAYLIMGDVLREQGEMEAAEEKFTKAISIQPNNTEGYNRLGSLFAVLGKFSDAEQLFKAALAIDPECVGALNNLATMMKEVLAADDITAMENLYSTPGITEEQKSWLAFGLGRAYEKSDQHDKAFEFFMNANKMQRSHMKWDQRTHMQDQFIHIKKTFTDELFQKFSGSGLKDKTPIFILGMPRSGTTLVEQILATHSRVYGAGELDVLGNIFTSLNGRDRKHFQENFNQINTKDFERLGRDYIQQVREYSDAEFITDKMPGNFSYIGLIKLILPQAKVIYCRREPADICLSIFKHQFSEGHRYASDLKELGIYHRNFRALMCHWQDLMPDFIHTLRYEDMVNNQEDETRKLLEFCNLPWEEGCLDFYKTERPVSTLSLTQVRQPIYKSSSEIWKKYEKHLQPLLEELNRD